MSAKIASDIDALIRSEFQIIDTGIESLQIFQICESFLTKIQGESVPREIVSRSHVDFKDFFF